MTKWARNIRVYLNALKENGPHYTYIIHRETERWKENQKILYTSTMNEYKKNEPIDRVNHTRPKVDLTIQ